MLCFFQQTLKISDACLSGYYWIKMILLNEFLKLKFKLKVQNEDCLAQQCFKTSNFIFSDYIYNFDSNPFLIISEEPFEQWGIEQIRFEKLKIKWENVFDLENVQIDNHLELPHCQNHINKLYLATWCGCSFLLHNNVLFSNRSFSLFLNKSISLIDIGPKWFKWQRWFQQSSSIFKIKIM